MGEQGAEWRAFPRCRRCGRGELVPLSDFGPQGGEVRYKAWVCTAPACGFAVKIRGGEITRGASVTTRTAGAEAVTRPAASPHTPPRRAAPPAAAPPRTPPGPRPGTGAPPGPPARPK